MTARAPSRTASSPTTSTPPPTSTPWSGSSGQLAARSTTPRWTAAWSSTAAATAVRVHTLPMSDVRAGDAGRLRRVTASGSSVPGARPRRGGGRSASWSPTSPARSRRRCWCARSPSGMREAKAAGKKVLWVGGPGVVHTGAAPAMVALVEAGYVDVLFAGNALATHDIESVAVRHLARASTSPRAAASSTATSTTSARSTRSARPARSRRRSSPGVLTGGVMHALVTHGKQFVLVGSVRDDGPLPDVYTDVIEGQRAMRAELTDVGFCLMVATMLHSVATGNILPASIPLVCVDINPATVTKLADRGSRAGARHRHRHRAVPRAARPRARPRVTCASGRAAAPASSRVVGRPRLDAARPSRRRGGPGRPRRRARPAGRARRRRPAGPGRNPRPGSARSSRSRAGASTISPSSLTPPPMTTTSGSRIAARSAMPWPSQLPTSVTQLERQRVAVGGGLGDDLAGEPVGVAVRPAPAGRAAAAGDVRGDLAGGLRQGVAAGVLLPAAAVAAGAAAGRRARPACAPTPRPRRASRGCSRPSSTMPPPMPVPSVIISARSAAAGRRRSGTRPRPRRWRRCPPTAGAAAGRRGPCAAAGCARPGAG